INMGGARGRPPRLLDWSLHATFGPVNAHWPRAIVLLAVLFVGLAAQGASVCFARRADQCCCKAGVNVVCARDCCVRSAAPAMPSSMRTMLAPTLYVHIDVLPAEPLAPRLPDVCRAPSRPP